MAVGDLAELRMLTRMAAGDILECGFGFVAVTGAAAWRQQLAEDWDTYIVPQWFVGMSEEAAYYFTVVKDVVPGGGEDGEAGDSSAIGDVAEPSLPLNTAAKIQWRTGLAGRSYRGGNYIGGYPVTGLVNGRFMTSTVAGHVEDLATAIFNRYQASPAIFQFKSVIISRQLNGVQRPVPIGTLINDWTVEGTWRTQRRRLHL